MGKEIGQANRTPVLEIITLGDFQVKFGDKILTKEANRSYRLWELFKFLLTNNGQGMLPEVIVEKLWPEQEYVDAKSAVSNMVYRLRQLLTAATGEDGSNYILFNQGAYLWNTEAHYWFDAAEFEKLSQQAKKMERGKSAEIIPLLEKSISLYKGDYLMETTYSEWVLLQRHYYHRLFLENVVTLCGLFKGTGQYEEIITLCEKAMAIDLYVEQIHIFYIEALIAQGEKHLAISHYGRITNTLYREMGIKPSKSMSHLHNAIFADGGVAEYDLTLIQKDLEESHPRERAFFCNSVVFRDLYRLEQRRAERSNREATLGLLTLILINPTDNQDINIPMEHLRKVLATCLRKNDVYTRWNDSQYLVMLTDVNHIKAKERVLERVKENFWQTWNGDPDQLLLLIKARPLTEENCQIA